MLIPTITHTFMPKNFMLKNIIPMTHITRILPRIIRTLPLIIPHLIIPLPTIPYPLIPHHIMNPPHMYPL